MALDASTHPSPLRSISGWVPLIFAAATMALLAGLIATGPHEPNIVIENGVPREDETAAARIWQLLMLAQVPAILFFAIRWLPRDPKRAAVMLGLQGLAFIAAALPVFLLEG